MAARENSKPIVTIVVIILLVILAIILIGALTGGDDATQTRGNSTTNTSSQADSQDAEADEQQIEQILENPQAYLGQTVTVTGEIEDVLSNRLFEISNEAVGNELLVVAPSALSEQQAEQATEFLQDNANVRVSGTVRQSTVVEFEREYGLDVGSEIEAEFEDRVLLIADRITFTDQSGGTWEFGDTSQQ